MTQPTGSPPAGWYHAEGDAPGTMRYWDGAQWIGQGVVPPAGSTNIAQPVVGEGKPIPELGLILAGPWNRIGARVIDGIILAIVGGILSIPILIGSIGDGDEAFSGAGGFQFGLNQYRDPALFAVLVISAILGAAYEIGFIMLKGATPGKMIAGVRVVGQDGESPPRFERSATRWLPELLGQIPFLGIVLSVLSLVWIFSDDRRRSLYDRVGRTYVVKK